MRRNNGKHKTGKDEKWPTITETVRQSILDLEGIVDITETMKNFDRLQYEQPPEYTPERIVNLRRKKLHMSQPESGPL
jgi:DNA-binding transcriptional regulator YiaG